MGHDPRRAGPPPPSSNGPMPAPPAPLLAVDAAELRELIRDAHGAVKDLRAAIRDARQLAGDAATLAAAGVAEAASKELTRFARHLQAEQNRNAADLNAIVERARDHIVKALTMATLEPDDDFRIFKVRFRAGPLFDQDVPLPGGGDEGARRD